MNTLRSRIALAFAGGMLLVAVGVYAMEMFTIPSISNPAVFVRTPDVPFLPPERDPLPPAVERVEKPDAVKAVYLSQCGATAPSIRDSLLRLAEDTEINAIIVDLKDYSGTVAFPSDTALPGGKGCVVQDFRELVKEMHERDIYVIGRMHTFQDPVYVSAHPEHAVKKESAPEEPWRDHKGLPFADVGAKPFWEYIITLSKEAHALGVDEINFDYVRFPSDGNMSDIHYDHAQGVKAEELEQFFKHLSSEMRKPDDWGHAPVLSADLFGMTTTNYDDLNIGQVLERALPYFDHIAPMVYPSHYPPNFYGIPDPNKNVYGVVHHSMSTSVRRVTATTTTVASVAFTPIMETVVIPAEGDVATTTRQEPTGLYKKPAYDADVMRPWLQDFNYPVPYTPEMVRAQIQAVYDAGLDSWMFWDPANRYTSLRQVLKEE